MSPQDTVRALLSAERPDLAALPLGEALAGWDNHMVRLGEGLVVRVPRRPIAVELLTRELDWLPRVAAQTGVPIPVAVHRGGPVPGVHAGPWAVVPWTPGTVAADAALGDRDAQAGALGALLRRLHAPAPADAPVNPAGRGGPLTGIVGRLRERLAQAASEGAVATSGAGEPAGPLTRAQAEAATAVVQAGLRAEEHAGPGMWVHGDPHAANTVLGEAGPVLVDWGDLGHGDPACDLGWAWEHVRAPARAAFWEAYGIPDPARDPRVARARVWALHFGLIFLTQPGEGADPVRGRTLIERALAEPA